MGEEGVRASSAAELGPLVWVHSCGEGDVGVAPTPAWTQLGAKLTGDNERFL